MNNVVGENLTNFPSDEGYNCPHCDKFIPKREVVFFGKKSIVQPRCECEWNNYQAKIKQMAEYERIRKIEQLFSISNMGERLQIASFDNFQLRFGAETAFKETRKYALGFENFHVSLLLWGDPGNGKSHLAAAVANELSKKGKIVVFQSVPELLERIRKTFNRNHAESEQEIMFALQNCDLLILDDIGSEKITDWVSDVLFRIIDGRYRRKAHTFYTSNLKPSELATRLDDKGRIYDRILETTLPIQNKATSFREQQAKERFENYRRGEFE